jgi:hypothetical protein
MLHHFSSRRNAAASSSSRHSSHFLTFNVQMPIHTVRQVGVLFSPPLIRPDTQPYGSGTRLLPNIARGACIVALCEIPIQASVHFQSYFAFCLPNPSNTHSISSKMQCTLLFPAFASRYIALAPILTKSYLNWASMLLNSTSSTTTCGRTDSRNVVQPHCW